MLFEPGDNAHDIRAWDLRDEREEEIEWLADLIPARTGVDRQTVVKVLWARDKAIAEDEADG